MCAVTIAILLLRVVSAFVQHPVAAVVASVLYHSSLLLSKEGCKVKGFHGFCTNVCIYFDHFMATCYPSILYCVGFFVKES